MLTPKRGYKNYPKLTLANLEKIKLYSSNTDKTPLFDGPNKKHLRNSYGINTLRILEICKSFGKEYFNYQLVTSKVNVKDNIDKSKISTALYNLCRRKKLEKVTKGSGPSKLTVYKNVG